MAGLYDITLWYLEQSSAAETARLASEEELYLAGRFSILIIKSVAGPVLHSHYFALPRSREAEEGASAGGRDDAASRGDTASNCSGRSGVGSFVSDAARTSAYRRRRRDTASREAGRLLRPWSASRSRQRLSQQRRSQRQRCVPHKR